MKCSFWGRGGRNDDTSQLFSATLHCWCFTLLMCASTVIQPTVWPEWKTKRGTLHTRLPWTPFVARVSAGSWESRFWTFILKRAKCLWLDSKSFAQEAIFYLLIYFLRIFNLYIFSCTSNTVCITSSIIYYYLYTQYKSTNIGVQNLICEWKTYPSLCKINVKSKIRQNNKR